MMKNKKGYTVQELLPIGIAFVVLAIALTLGADILGEVQTDQDTLTASVATNETFTPVSGANVALAHPNIVSGSETLYNRTTGVCLSAAGANYTMDYPGGLINCAATASCCSFAAGDMNITYDWSYYGADYNVSGAGLESLQVFADWIPTVALIVIAAVLVGIVVLYLGRKFA